MPTRVAVNPVMSEAGTCPGSSGNTRGVSLGPRPSPNPIGFILLRDQTRPKSCPWQLLPVRDALPHPGGPSLPGPRHPGDSDVQMESKAQRWATGGTGNTESVWRQEMGPGVLGGERV